MGRSEFDANAGLSEGRRVNPGPAKLPTQTYMGMVDVLFVGAAVLTAAWFLGEFGGEVWNLLKSAMAVVTSAGR